MSDGSCSGPFFFDEDQHLDIHSSFDSVEFQLSVDTPTMENNPNVVIIEEEVNEAQNAATAGTEEANAGNKGAQPFCKKKRKRLRLVGNIFMRLLWIIEALDKVALDENDCMKSMACEMKKKFDKYWGSTNLLISVAAVLDPRYKMELVTLAFKSIYSEDKADQEKELVKSYLQKLFNEYVEASKEPNVGSSKIINVGSCPSGSKNGPSSFTSSRFGKSIESGSAKYNQHIRSVDCVEGAKSELTTYLEEGVCIVEPGHHFDALQWWKDNKLKYKILSKMAADILAIPITTVASESAFSAGGRVIDPHRSALGTKMVDMLICGADWYRHYYGLQKRKKKEYDDVVFVELP